jgi:fructuronate reductase
MRLDENSLADPAQWAAAGIELPHFDRAAMLTATRQSPRWVHFGGGNLFRAFPAKLQQTLLDRSLAETGIIVAEGYDYELVDRYYHQHDNLSLLVTLKADGSTEQTVIASIAEAIAADSARPDEFARLREIFRAPSLQLASFTITEKGYRISGDDGQPFADVAADFAQGPTQPRSYMGKVASLCYERYRNGAAPLALVSLDNCSHNGTRLYAAVSAFAAAWEQAGLTDAGFGAYLANPERVSFTWSMIDKITPRPDPAISEMLRSTGLQDLDGFVTSRGTFVSPFVNTEQTEYLVIEDRFPNGRPPLEEAGVIFTDRETVDKAEQMKVCTCLNPLHTALAIFGCLLGYRKISDELHDPDLHRLIEVLGYQEGLPAVVDPGIISPRAFLDEVLQVRLPNPFIPDTPQRIASDTSQKLSVRFGRTIQTYIDRPDLEVASLKAVPLVLAGWCRYLVGVDDNGAPMELSPDPLLPSLSPHFAKLRLGEAELSHELLAPLLADTELFGADLTATALAPKIEEIFNDLMAGPGAVRRALHARLDAQRATA